MSAQNLLIDSRYTFALQSLRVALHVPQDLSGVATAITVARDCLSLAVRHYSDPNLGHWKSVADALSKAFSEQAAKGSPDAARWYQPPTADSAPQSRLTTWRSSISPSEQELKLGILIGRAIAAAGSGNASVSPALIDGAHVLKNAKVGRGRRSPDWNILLSVDLLDSANLSQLYETTCPQAAHSMFLASVLAVLRSPIGSPFRKLPELASASASDNQPAAHDGSLHTHDDATETGSSAAPAPENGQKSRDDLFPDIGARLANSDYTSFSEKLGFVTRDYIDPDDLARITRQLERHLDGTDRQRSCLALFALVSLLTGCSDFIAVKLGFAPGQSIWLAADAGAWCWAFSAYRANRDHADGPAISEPIPVALPQGLALRLRRLRAAHQAASTLGDLISAELGATLELGQFREFLRSLGDSAHPPYGSRFAKSMSLVYLRTGGSDMSAAMLSGHFAIAAPAALFYYGPTYRLLHQRLSTAYAFLGLGTPTTIGNLGQRAGCQKVLEATQLQAGWARLTSAIIQTRARIATAMSKSARLADINRLMALLCAGFVIRTAHRGTRLERLTFGALFMHVDAILIADKNEGARAQPRLIPKPPAVKELLCAAAEVHFMTNPGLAAGVAHDTCLFVRWLGGQHQEMEPITTGHLAQVIGEFFEGSDYNFGRSAWVTHLDEDGCDRWLIRVLTGHTRDVTRTNGAYFDIAPLVAANRLARAMEHTGHRLFGNTTLSVDRADPVVLFRASGRERPKTAVSFMVPDPRTLLEPLSVTTLAGWRATHRLRHELVNGAIQAPTAALAVLQMLVMDFVPDPDLCIAALRQPGQVIRCHGKTAGLLWRRAHFTHPTWLPLLPTTARLIVKALVEPVSEAKLWESIGMALRSSDPGYWPASPEGCRAALLATARAFLRLEFPPSLLAVADPEVPAPSLSELSLMRLCDAQDISFVPPPSPTARLRTRSVAASRPGQDLNALRKIIYARTSQTVRLGELRKRALDCLTHIRADVQVQSTFGAWVLDWVVDELQQSAQDLKGRLDISSLNTYLGVLTRRPRPLADVDMEDPYEWSEGQWQQWLEALNADLTGEHHAFSLANMSDGTPSAETQMLHKRVKDAVGRMVRNLIQRGHWVPSSIRSILAEGNEKLPCGSASACLVTVADVERAIQIARKWLEDQPLDALMLETRARIQFCIPTRSSEISNLRFDCMTASGMLLIERAGYKNIKNENSVRSLKAPDTLQQLIRDFKAELIQYLPDAAFLFRSDGSPEAGLRDVELINLQSAALKHATGDPSARPHSKRASALQSMAWPGWMPLAMLLLKAKASPRSCSAWTGDLSDWTRLAYAASMAGHGDLRAGLGNYLSGWSLVFAIRAMALLDRQDPRPGLLLQLGVDPAGLRKFRQRAPEGSCQWQWLFGRVVDDSVDHLRSRVQPVCTRDSNLDANSEQALSTAARSGKSDKDPACLPPDPPATYVPTDKGTAGTRPELDSVIYLSARILGMPKPQAIEMTRIGLSRATYLDTLIPPDELVLMAASRARSAPRKRGSQGNLEVLFSDRGREILEWVVCLNGRDLLTAARFVFRLRSKAMSDQNMAEFWGSMLTGLPNTCALHVHRGERYLHDAERSVLSLNNGPVILKFDSEIGAIPGIRLATLDTDNRVLGTRLNSVFRSGLLSCVCISGGLRLDA